MRSMRTDATQLPENRNTATSDIKFGSTVTSRFPPKKCVSPHAISASLPAPQIKHRQKMDIRRVVPVVRKQVRRGDRPVTSAIPALASARNSGTRRCLASRFAASLSAPSKDRRLLQRDSRSRNRTPAPLIVEAPIPNRLINRHAARNRLSARSRPVSSTPRPSTFLYRAAMPEFAFAAPEIQHLRPALPAR